MVIVRIDVGDVPLHAYKNAYAIDATIGSTYTMKVECPMTIIGPGGAHRVDPETADEHDLALLADARADVVDIGSDGTLSIGLSDGRRIVVGPDPDYEAWAFRGPEGNFIALPGGGLA